MPKTVFQWRDAPAGDFAVIGDPIEHSLSPRMHAAAFASLNETYTYHAIRVREGEVKLALDHLKALGYKGINVTIPHKAEAFDAASSTNEFSKRIKVVNTIRPADMSAINTDGPGFIETLAGRIETGSRVLLLGAGGSARAIALSLALAGYNMRVFNRTKERAVSLIRELEIDAEVVDDPAAQDVHLIVNATSTSLQNVALTVPFEEAAPNALAYDLVYGETQFLADAAKAGLRTMDGGPLLVAQGALSQEFWLDRPAPRQVMWEAIA